MDEGELISYMAVSIGTPVHSTSETEFGKVEHVLQDPSLDLFDGLVVKVKREYRFVDREQITELRTTVIRTSLTDAEAAALPAPRGTLVLHPDPSYDDGTSLTARFGRLFGRKHWLTPE